MPPFNPFDTLAEGATKFAADTWTAVMLALWNAGLYLLQLVLEFLDAFTTPDVSESGPAAEAYRFTFWMAGALCLLLVFVQLALAAARRDGRALAQVAIGFGQFVMVWAGLIAYVVALVAACGGLTVGAMKALLKVDSWAAWRPWEPLTVSDVSTEPVVATVLGLLSGLLWVAAIAHVFVMLTRAGALLVLACTAPISAAGAVSEVGRAWLWKTLRWIHAAALTPVLVVLVLGVGIGATSGVAAGIGGSSLRQQVGTAVPGVVLILISAFAPLALFRLLAFVDPSTATGAAMRRGLEVQGGLRGLLAGPSGAGSSSGAATSGAASDLDDSGRSSAESSGDQAMVGRFGQAMKALGPVGQVAGKGLDLMQGIAQAGAAVGTDLTNQMGVGHHGYHPDVDTRRSSSGQHPAQRPDSGETDPTTGWTDAAGPSGTQATSWTDLSAGPSDPSQPVSGATASPKAAPAGAGGTAGAPAGAAGGAASEAAVVAVL